MRALVGISLSLASLLALAETNLVRNARFERVDEKGRAEAWRGWGGRWRTDWLGMDGSRAAVFENADTNYYGTVSQVVDARPGRRYRFGGFVKTENLRGKVHFCLEWYGPNGKYVGGSYTAGLGGTADWTEQSNITPPLPTNAVKVLFQAFCAHESVGKAIVDGAYLRPFEAPPVDGVYSSRYRNRAAEGPVRFVAVLNDGAGSAPGDAARFVFTDPENPKGARRVAATVTNGAASVACDVSDLAPGVNLVRFELARGGAVHVASLVFERVTPEEEAAPAVRIDAFGRTIVDGKPFFPLGMYWSKVDPRLIGAYREGPFNCLMPYHAPNRREMDLCASNGLKVIYNVVGKDLSDGAIVRRFRRHPALLAWYLNDERPISERDALARARTFAELHDPDHPGWIAIYQYYEVRSYLPTFDVVGTDPYPLYRNPIGMVTKWTRATRDGLMGLKPMWQIPQVFDKGAYASNRKNFPDACRPPTYDDMRNMAWQCLAGGANGLVFYSFFDLVAMDAKTPFRQRWEDVKRMACEIKSYEAYFLSTDAPPPVAGAPDALACRAWRLGGKTLFVAVNTTREPLSADVTVDGQPVSLALGPTEVKIIENSKKDKQ